MLISVIVPVYGAEKYLDKCVKSIMGQTGIANGTEKQPQEQKQPLSEMVNQEISLEIILVDDGSKDRGGKMCDEYAAMDSRIRVLHKQNGGLMSAWIAGVNISHGDYLCFVDSDDWIEPDMISKMAAELETVIAEPARKTAAEGQIICCNHYIDRPGGSSEPQRHALLPGIYTGEILRKKIFNNILGNENRTISMSRCMKLISKQLITDNLHYCDTAIKMGEDMNIILPVILDSRRIVVMEDSFFYHYLYNDVSMVHKYDADLSNNIGRLMKIVSVVMHDKLDKMNSMIDCAYDIESELMRERQFMFMLQLKNEFRNTAPAVVRRVIALCEENNIQLLTDNYPVNVINKGNRLLYAIMKKPDPGRILAAYLLFRFKNKSTIHHLKVMGL